MAKSVGRGSNGKQFLGISGGSTTEAGLPGEYERVGSGRERQEGHGWRKKDLREEIAVRSGVQRRRNWFSQARMGGFE